MNYIGSKLSLLEFLEESINKVVDKNCDTFCDLFAGTGIVGRYFKTKGYKIIAVCQVSQRCLHFLSIR